MNKNTHLISLLCFGLLLLTGYIIFESPDTVDSATRTAEAVATEKLLAYKVGENTVGLSIDPRTGVVGVGTATPDTRLHVVNGNAELIKLQHSGQDGGSWQFKVGGDGWNNGQFMIVDRTNDRDLSRITIAPDGDVYIPGNLVVDGSISSEKSTLNAQVEVLQMEISALDERLRKLETTPATALPDKPLAVPQVDTKPKP
jgi:hypothetical protein